MACLIYDPKQLGDVDEVQVVDLRGRDADAASDYMMPPNLASARVHGAAAEEIAQLWRRLPAGDQMRCHVPPFGLRFFAGGTLSR